jgi:hypothetical protein
MRSEHPSQQSTEGMQADKRPHMVRAQMSESQEVVEYPVLNMRSAMTLADILRQTGHLVEIVRLSD